MSLPGDDEEPAGASGFSAEVLERLGERKGAFGRYVLMGEIGRGGQGAVMRVWDEDLRRALAMKVLLGEVEPDASGTTPPVDGRTLGRFLEEAQVTGQLDHPGIVPVHELGLDADGRVYFTMKLVRGRTLKQVLDLAAAGEEGWSQTRVLGVIAKACEAMAYAHHKGVVHRDLKPANVMVGRFGEVYVMDWGLAKVLGREDTKNVAIAPPAMTQSLSSERRARAEAAPDSPLLTMDGDVVGTPAYMPPEQALGRADALGPHSDVYAMGAILYHLFAAHMPYVEPGMRLSNYDVWYRAQKGPPAPLSERAPHVPAELAAICERAMAREIEERYAGMADLAADLSAYLERRVVSAYETGAWAEARKWVQRNKPLAASFFAAVVLLVGGLVTSLAFKARADENAERALEQAELAERRAEETAEQERIARESERVATARAEDVLRLSALQDLEDLLADADALWPAHPENVAAYREWIARGEELVAELPRHRAKRAELRALALPRSAQERQRERESHPEHARIAGLRGALDASRRALFQRRDGIAAELPAVQAAPDASATALAAATAEQREEFAGYLAKLEQAIAAATSDEGLEEAARELGELESQLASLEAGVDERREWRFPAEHGEARWWNAQLTKLVEGLEALVDEEAGLLAAQAVSAEHGWSVAQRLAFAQRLESGFAQGGAYADRWAATLPAIRAAYPGLELEPQIGLVPLGPDPNSGLWEFAHLATGEPALPGADGKLALTEETGVVLVLIPGGTFWMGAQAVEPEGRNYDPQAQSDESPVHEVELSAYFLSKYELTQGQWKRFAGSNPSNYGPDRAWDSEWSRASRTASLLHPVERVSWDDCAGFMVRTGLALPTEAQWERACRAETDTPWWTGRELEGLGAVANVADGYGKNHGAGTWTAWEAALDDGFTNHAPVGSFRANPFGLFDVHGNVWEWCRDGLGDYDLPMAQWDGERQGAGPRYRVNRGGGFRDVAAYARCANRGAYDPEYAVNELGVRPARVITGSFTPSHSSPR